MPVNRTAKLRRILQSRALSFLLEAHDGISSKIVEEAGFEGIWASGLCIAASMGVRDNNEATWTQVLEVAEYMSDVTTIPILLDGDTGYGDFNTVRRVVKKLEQRGIAGICIEDKLFPKSNSFIDGEKQELETIEGFCGKIKAARDSCQDQDFCVVARIEAFIAGWGVDEALKRAHAYHQAGADAILVHSKRSRPDEILDFMQEWGQTCPVVIVPTKYYSTPTRLFEELGVSTVIWANHLMRGAVSTMQEIAREIHQQRSLVEIEDRVAPVAEIFRLQGADELQEAEKRYLPQKSGGFNAVILAASRGEELGSLTKDAPKVMVPISGKPLLHRMTSTLNDIGIKDITLVRGYRKDMIKAPNIHFIDNDDYAETKEVYSLHLAGDLIRGETLVSFGDILFKKYIPMNLIDDEGEITIAVDAEWQGSRNRGRYSDFVSCDQPYSKEYFEQKVLLRRMGNDLEDGCVHGEWIGLFKVASRAAEALCETLQTFARRTDFRSLRMSDLFNEMIAQGQEVRVVYIRGHWLDVDDLYDLSEASTF